MSLRLVAVPKISIGDFWSGENPRTKWRPSLGRTCATTAEFRTKAFVVGIRAKTFPQILSTSVSPFGASATRNAAGAAAVSDSIAGETVRAALALAPTAGDGACFAAETVPVRLGPADTEELSASAPN